jgi:hypothetical protein
MHTAGLTKRVLALAGVRRSVWCLSYHVGTILSMTAIGFLPCLLLRKAPVFALLMGLGTAAISWWLLPPPSRFSLHLGENYHLVFSRDLRYLAFSTCISTEKELTGETSLWDTNLGCLLCSFPFRVMQLSPGEYLSHAKAFSKEGTMFVEFERGVPQFREVATGNIAQGMRPLTFSHDKNETIASSRMISEASGRLLVLVKERNKAWSVRDLVNGAEVNSFSMPSDRVYFRWPGRPAQLPGVAVFYSANDNSAEVRHIPSGKHLFDLEEYYGDGTPYMDNWAITPDGKTEVAVGDGTIHVFDGLHGTRAINVPAHRFPVISPTGQYLLVKLQPGQTLPLLAWLRTWLSILPKPEDKTALYDLESGSKMTYFRDAYGVQFAHDARRFAILSEDTLAIYDLPLAKQWIKIASLSLLAAVAAFLVNLVKTFIQRNKTMGRGPSVP